jgi:hypothetical protein
MRKCLPCLEFETRSAEMLVQRYNVAKHLQRKIEKFSADFANTYTPTQIRQTVLPNVK